MDNNLEILNDDDVISVLQNDEGRFIDGDTLKVIQLLAEYRQYVMQSKANSNNLEILEQGIKCQILRHDSDYKGWRKGKIKFIIQFEPDEIENIDNIKNNDNLNSLDDIRKQIKTTNQ